MNQDLISFEGLVHWNPVKLCADKNLEVFGSDAFVILTLRSPKDYLRSLYQQQIHEGSETLFLMKFILRLKAG